MAEIISTSPADLLIDEENPRLPQPNAGQREAQRGIAADQGRKIVILAKDIVEWGLSPAELPIVMSRGDDLKRYVVLEGNRRMVALRALENPDTFVGALDHAFITELRALSKKYQEAPVERALCTLVKDREEAKHWIHLRHTGQNDGAGVVPWNPDQSVIFAARSGNLPIHTQALNFLEKRGDLKINERKKIPTTSYRRLLETPAVREKAGIELREGKMHLLGSEAAVAKALLFIARDLASGTTKVRKIYTSKQRIKYAQELPAEIVVANASGGGAAGNSGSTSRAKSKTQTKPKRTKPREYLIPRDCILSVTDERVQDIENELRILKLEDFPNAISVLFRVFLELSADAYIADKKLTTSIEAKLSTKLLDVASHLISQQKLTKQQAVPIRKACQGDSFLGPSITLMNKYVHCQHLFPAPGDLRAYWKSLQPFVAALWSP